MDIKELKKLIRGIVKEEARNELLKVLSEGTLQNIVKNSVREVIQESAPRRGRPRKVEGTATPKKKKGTLFGKTELEQHLRESVGHPAERIGEEVLGDPAATGPLRGGVFNPASAELPQGDVDPAALMRTLEENKKRAVKDPYELSGGDVDPESLLGGGRQ